MYNMIKQNKIDRKLKETKKAKGVKKSEMKNINYETFKDVLLNCTQHKVDYYKLQTSNTKPEDKHKIHLKKFTKKGLSCFDDKRYILSDGIHTLPYGNEKIKLKMNWMK